MKAYALTAPDQPAALVDLPDPEVPDGGVLIRVRAASVNGIDLYEANGYLAQAMPHDYPVVVGRDLAGVVEAVGAGRTDVAVAPRRHVGRTGARRPGCRPDAETVDGLLRSCRCDSARRCHCT